MNLFRLISTRAHSTFDYIMGLLLISIPFLFGFHLGGWETWVPIIIGSVMLVYSILTQYELGVAKFIPLSIHFVLDLICGLFLAFSPWLLGFSGTIFLPHLVTGLILIGSVLVTYPQIARS